MDGFELWEIAGNLQVGTEPPLGICAAEVST